jgi:hypothetical protein
MADQHDDALLETYRAEALALFSVNQAGRAAAERIGALLLTLIGIAIAAGINAHTDAVAIALGPICLLLASYMFQQYADVSVTGAARAALEDRVAKGLGGRHGLIYEYAVADIRQTEPLRRSVRLLQGLSFVVLGGVVVTANVIALEGGRLWYVQAGSLLGTALGLWSAIASWRDMMRSGAIARRRIEARLDPGPDRNQAPL